MFFWPSVAHASTFMPEAGTALASDVDHLYGFLIAASVISFIILIGGMIYFVIKYPRRSMQDKTAYITHNHTLEFLWSFIPFLIFIFSFAWGWKIYHSQRDMPKDALEIHVYGKKWDWRFVYKNGKEALSSIDDKGAKIPPTMVVPVGRPVKLIMTSEKQATTDMAVIHSFYIPAFRVKQDVVPGRYTALWFQADKEGSYNVFCAEYCGTSHSQMRALIQVVSGKEFESWLAGETLAGEAQAAKPANPMLEVGKKVYAQKACNGCHSLDGSVILGPSLKGIWNKKETISDGSQVLVDENYIRESLLNPQAKIVKGFEGKVMPPFQGVLSEEEITGVIEFIKNLK